MARRSNMPPGEIRPYPRPPVLVTAVSCPPAISFYTLPQLHIWKDWVKGIRRIPIRAQPRPVRLVRRSRRDPRGGLDGRQPPVRSDRQEDHGPDAGSERRSPRRRTTRRREPARSKKNEIEYERGVARPGDHVLIARRAAGGSRGNRHSWTRSSTSPWRRSARRRSASAANNLIRISVLVKRPMHSLPGKGGVIIRDSIGGDQFQFRISDAHRRLLPRGPLPQGAGRRDVPRHAGPGGLRRGLLRRLPRPGDRGRPPESASRPGPGPATSAGGRFATTAGPPSARPTPRPGSRRRAGPGDLDRTAPNSSTHAPLAVGSRPICSRRLRNPRALLSRSPCSFMDPPPTRRSLSDGVPQGP